MDRNSQLELTYIMGRGRSGSTFYENELSRKNSSTCLGEVRLWPECYVADHLCTCGAPKTECEFWNPVLSGLRNYELSSNNFRFLLSRRSIYLIFLPVKIVDFLHPTLRETVGELYSSVNKINNTKGVLDSSKNPIYGWLLSTLPLIDSNFIYLYRHPLGVAYSWKRQRMRPQTNELYKVRKSVYLSTIEWSVSTIVSVMAIVRIARPVKIIRYEELGIVTNEASTTSNEVECASHFMSGNPGRSSRDVRFEPDMEWEAGLNKFEKTICYILSAPAFFLIRTVEKIHKRRKM